MRFAALLHDAAKPLTRGDAAGRPRDVPRPRRRGRRARARRAAAPARVRSGWPTTSPRSPATTCGSASSSTSARCRAARSGATWARPSPTPADVTVFTVADRLATRGKQRRAGDRRPPRARARDARAGARAPRRGAAASRSCAATSSRASWACAGRRSARLLAELEEAQYAGEIAHPRGRAQPRALAARLIAASATRARRRHRLVVDVARDVALRVVVGRHLVLVAGGERGRRAARRAAPTARRWRSRARSPRRSGDAGVAAPPRR